MTGCSLCCFVSGAQGIRAVFMVACFETFSVRDGGRVYSSYLIGEIFLKRGWCSCTRGGETFVCSRGRGVGRVRLSRPMQSE